MPIGNNILAGASGQATGYDVENSLRFDDGDSAYLGWTSSATPTDSTKATFSCWFKLGSGAEFSTDMTTWAYRTIVGWGHSTDGRTSIGLHDQSVSGGLPCIGIKSTDSGGSMYFNYLSNAVIRDFSAWYNLVVVWDGSIGTAVNRIKAYLNGTELTWSTSSNSQSDFYISGRGMPVATVGANYGGSYQGHWDGYIAETYWIDGQALTPASFGETNSDTNQWVPIEYAGSYGTNGFYLKFQDSAALGDDSSGNTNDFTATNLVATDQVLDSPTNNFTTFNSVCKDSNAVLSEGNLKIIGSAHFGASVGTIGASSGKWYWEMVAVTSIGGYIGTGIAKETSTDAIDSLWAGGTDSISYYPDGKIYNNGSTTSTSMPTYAVGDIIGIAVDLDNYKLYFSKNNSWINSGDPTSGSTGTGSVATPASVGWLPVAHGSGSSSGYVANFGQDSSFAGNKTAQGNQDGNSIGDFYYTPPSGYLALCSDNLSDPAIALPTDHFNTLLFVGDGASSRAVTGVGFAPDWSWLKNRGYASTNHFLMDSVRGDGWNIKSSSSDGQAAHATMLKTLDSDGFTVGSGDVNANGYNIVSWNWKAGGTAVSNTDGTITSSVSANTDAGFSIATYTGNESAATVGHGLSSAPELVMVKRRDTAANWIVGSDELQTSYWDYYIMLNSTAAEASESSNFGYNTNPTATTFPLGNNAATNASGGTYVAYCFHSVDAYSKIGSYTGNGNADGTFIYTGFRPSWVLVKRSNAVHNWYMFDNKRDVYNAVDANLQANDYGAEDDGPVDIDFVSNGIKLRDSGNATNNSGGSYIYLAFAESPFKTANAR